MVILAQLVDDIVINKTEIPSEGLTIGRAASNDIRLDDPSVSQKHAKIEVKETKDGTILYFLQDLNSTNHTFVNGKEINEAVMTDGDVIVIGMMNFKFINDDEDALAKTKVFKKSWIPGMMYLED